MRSIFKMSEETAEQMIGRLVQEEKIDIAIKLLLEIKKILKTEDNKKRMTMEEWEELFK